MECVFFVLGVLLGGCSVFFSLCMVYALGNGDRRKYEKTKRADSHSDDRGGSGCIDRNS